MTFAADCQREVGLGSGGGEGGQRSRSNVRGGLSCSFTRARTCKMNKVGAKQWSEKCQGEVCLRATTWK